MQLVISMYIVSFAGSFEEIYFILIFLFCILFFNMHSILMISQKQNILVNGISKFLSYHIVSVAVRTSFSLCTGTIGFSVGEEITPVLYSRPHDEVVGGKSAGYSVLCQSTSPESLRRLWKQFTSIRKWKLCY